MISGADWALRGTAVPALIGVLVAAAGCGDARPPVIELGGPTMGTTWSIRIAAGDRPPDPAERDAIDRDVRALLDRIDSLVSTWADDSELLRFNRSRTTDFVRLSPETFEMFETAATVSRESGGAFDVTVGPLVEAWGFGASQASGDGPDAETLATLRARTGMALIELDGANRQVRKLQPDVECDFSALAPGYAADALAGLLLSRGLRHFLVDVGGEMVARGRNQEGRPWRVGIEPPDERGRGIASVVELNDLAVATSGDYRNYRVVNGERVSHIIDPRTGRPGRHRLLSVSVVAQRAARADALATALLVLGPEEGMALARERDLAVMFVAGAEGAQRFETRATPQFEALLANER